MQVIQNVATWLQDRDHVVSLSKGLFLAGLGAFFVIRHPIHSRYNKEGREAIKESRVDWREIALLSGVGVGSLVLPLSYVFLANPSLAPVQHFANGAVARVFSRFDYSSLGARGVLALTAAGVLAEAAGLYLFWRSHYDLAENWSPSLELRHEHRLVTSGVYTYVRHPLYLSVFMLAASQALLLPNWLAGWPMLASFAPLYWVRVTREERMMEDAFGQELGASSLASSDSNSLEDGQCVTCGMELKKEKNKG
ncbi:hypothetical protein QOT17_016707 [Balamuthia mandrillaris]